MDVVTSLLRDLFRDQKDIIGLLPAPTNTIFFKLDLCIFSAIRLDMSRNAYHSQRNLVLVACLYKKTMSCPRNDRQDHIGTEAWQT